MDDVIYYECFSMFDKPDQSLHIISAADQCWSTVEGPLSAHRLPSVAVDNIDDTSYLNDLTIHCPTEDVYWDGFLTLNDPTLCILAHSTTTDQCCCIQH